MGEFSLSSFSAVDASFGRLIVDAVNALNPNSCSYNLQEFLKRDSKRQVIRGQYDSAREFLRAVRRYQKASKDTESFNKSTLPVIQYYRPMGFESASSEFASFVESSTGLTDDGLQSLNISISYVTLNYKVVFIGSDRESVELMALSWHMYVSKKRGGGSNFSVNYNLSGSDIEVPLQIEDPQTFDANGVTDGESDEKLFALETSYEVNAPVLYGREVSYPSPIKWTVGIDIMEP